MKNSAHHWLHRAQRLGTTWGDANALKGLFEKITDAGAPLPEDLIAEVATLRAELDMLKSVLRRHMRLSEK